ncbi:hypothetical protein [Bernardetia litoralis]|uniref:hypothetical protein n=1 Tax=Bernardetia litoralis TaxID=999 RepID=UPI001FE13A96|nr:hypothetical protein [Bernardetia litoralis]
MLLISVFICQTLVAQKNVLQAYKELQKHDTELNYYKLYQKTDKSWNTNSSADYEMPITVDFKNGYIEFTDDGTGGGSIGIQVVLFRTIDKKELVGVITERFDGYFFESTYHFWKSTDSGWKDVTDEVLPTTFNYADFIKNKSENVNPDFYKNVKYRILLPQHGTTAKLHWYFKEQKDCSDNNDNQSYCDSLKKMKKNSYNYLELIWDKANTRFNVGESVEE